ncbi:MAG: hypothetical protein Q8P83_03230 [bacterium]|nr:hypothetical protein [bacterium]
MSWMNPENITPRETDPRNTLGKFREEFGQDGMTVLGIIGDLDPLRIYEEDDEYDDKRSRRYISQASRFMTLLGERNLHDLSEEELRIVLEQSFDGTSAVNLDLIHSHLVETIKDLRSLKKPDQDR